MAKPPRQYGTPVGVAGGPSEQPSAPRPKPQPATAAQAHAALRKEFAPSDKIKPADEPKKKLPRGTSSPVNSRMGSMPGLDAMIEKIDH